MKPKKLILVSDQKWIRGLYEYETWKMKVADWKIDAFDMWY